MFFHEPGVTPGHRFGGKFPVNGAAGRGGKLFQQGTILLQLCNGAGIALRVIYPDAKPILRRDDLLDEARNVRTNGDPPAPNGLNQSEGTGLMQGGNDADVMLPDNVAQFLVMNGRRKTNFTRLQSRGQALSQGFLGRPFAMNGPAKLDVALLERGINSGKYQNLFLALIKAAKK